jgi:hypothetical protein
VAKCSEKRISNFIVDIPSVVSAAEASIVVDVNGINNSTQERFIHINLIGCQSVEFVYQKKSQ